MKSDHRKRKKLIDVAKEAQRSTATVSEVLNDLGYCSKEICSGVQKAVEKPDCQPNLHAKILRQRRSDTIGLLIPNLSTAYCSALAADVRCHGDDPLWITRLLIL